MNGYKLRRCPYLVFLYFRGTQITDAGLRKLGHIDSLRAADFTANKNLTKQGIDAFRRMNPDAIIRVQELEVP